MRYPSWGTAIAVLSVASAFYYATYESSADNYVTLAGEFVIAFVITFAGWYALVLLVGWAWELIQRARGVRVPDATENRRAVAGLPGLRRLAVPLTWPTPYATVRTFVIDQPCVNAVLGPCHARATRPGRSRSLKAASAPSSPSSDHAA
jgi:hypothetical protein